MKGNYQLSIERLWARSRFTPNDEQRDSILHVDGPLYLTAGPGSGKTRVLLWRTVNLLVFHNVKPEEVFLSTFTEKAALQLKQGLQSLLGIVTNINGKPYDLSQMYIGTVHSLCQRILSDRRRFELDLHSNRPPNLLDDLGQYFHLYRNRVWQSLLEQAGLDENGNAIINAIWGYPSLSKHRAINNVRSIFNRFSEEQLDPELALDTLHSKKTIHSSYFSSYGLQPEQIELLLKLYSAYRASLLLNNGGRLVDFALLQQEAFQVLQQFSGSSHVFKHIIVDEYQDTNTIQERIFFHLAGGSKNICVVGDDDQALYRFRGATVENFVEFPTRCSTYLGSLPRRISLDTNYRSQKPIVNFYKDFIKQIDWTKPGGQGYYRVSDKNIQPFRKDTGPALVASSQGQPENVYAEIAEFVRRLIDTEKVNNPNQIAFLFPSLKYNGAMNLQVERAKKALEAVGLEVYAPRAGRFLDVTEARDIFGLIFKIIGRPSGFEFYGKEYASFHEWADSTERQAEGIIRSNPKLEKFISDKKKELKQAEDDYRALLSIVNKNHWDLKAEYKPDRMKRALYSASGLSKEGKRQIGSTYLDKLVVARSAQGHPFTLRYILKRATSIDWNLLDLFYRLSGFEHFKKMFDTAEKNGDEGPVANLGLITQYLARFVEERVPLITADLLEGRVFQQVLFSYLFALFRLGETELEDVDDPFPKGRIPFLTIHQAKGLEFPVVVLGNLRKDDKGPNRAEVIMRPLMEREPGEPLNRMSEFDIMRMFYVALSRAKNLLILAHFKGRGQRISKPFKTMLDEDFLRIPNLNISAVTPAVQTDESLPKVYSFTSDFLQYQKCPRQYMIFRKFGFVPSRSQTMFFGSLVHRTLEDLHHELIRRRQVS